MNIIKKPTWDISSSEVTPEELFNKRRTFFSLLKHAETTFAQKKQKNLPYPQGIYICKAVFLMKNFK